MIYFLRSHRKDHRHTRKSPAIRRRRKRTQSDVNNTRTTHNRKLERRRKRKRQQSISDSVESIVIDSAKNQKQTDSSESTPSESIKALQQKLDLKTDLYSSNASVVDATPKKNSHETKHQDISWAWLVNAATYALRQENMGSFLSHQWFSLTQPSTVTTSSGADCNHLATNESRDIDLPMLASVASISGWKSIDPHLLTHSKKLQIASSKTKKRSSKSPFATAPDGNLEYNRTSVRMTNSLSTKAISPGISMEEPQTKNRVSRKIARIRTFDDGKWSEWYTIHLEENSNWSYRFQRGGWICFFPNFLSKNMCKRVSKQIYKDVPLHQYEFRNGGFKEPRLHALVSKAVDQSEHQTDTATPGYKYHGIQMKAGSIYDFPIVEKVADHVSNKLQIDFNIGVDLLVYRNGQDKIGWHADDTQGEDRIFTMIVDSYLPARRVRIRPKRTKRKRLELMNGDEQIELYPQACDGYLMDGEMQVHYEHCLPKTMVAKSKRCALVFRRGENVNVSKDSGSIAISLDPPPIKKVEYTFGRMESVLVEGNLYGKNELVERGAHGNLYGGVSGNSNVGCDSVVVVTNNAALREEDHFVWLLYSSDGRQRMGALYTSKTTGLPIRVFRSSKAKGPYKAPKAKSGGDQLRYDGVYYNRAIWDADGSLNPSTVPVSNSATPPSTFLLIRGPENGNHAYDQSWFENIPSQPRRLLPINIEAWKNARRHRNTAG